jgi:hypothetical protein
MHGQSPSIDRARTAFIFLDLTAQPAHLTLGDTSHAHGLQQVASTERWRMRLYVAASVQRVGIRPRRPVRSQSILCETGSAQKAVPQVTAGFTPSTLVRALRSQRAHAA